MNNKKNIIKNLIFAFLAQSISMILSVLMSLIVPKALGVEEFGYWQLFIFYSSYIGFFHLGLNDGIYLKLGGEEYENLDKEKIGSQLKLSLVIESLVAIIISIIAFVFIKDEKRFFSILFTAISIPVICGTGFIGYIFQSVNKTRIYSISVMIDKILFIISVVALLLLKCENFKYFVILYVIGKIIAFAYCLYVGRKIVFSKFNNIKQTMIDIINNIKIGINLMISNIASQLIIGSTRFFIDTKWGVETFGKVSLSLSITNFFLTFISQISMVLFPVLRNVKEENQKKYYTYIKEIIEIILFTILLFYLPIKRILVLWLPKYTESLYYLGILLPICIFDSKMNLLCNTYFKVLRKEKSILKINVISLIISILLSLVNIYIFNDMNMVIIGIIISVAARCVISEIYLAKLMETSAIRDVLVEILMSTVFIVSNFIVKDVYAFFIYLVTFAIYAFINKSNIMNYLRKIKKV